MKAFWHQHSLSIVLAIITALFSIAAWFAASDNDNWLYDWSLMVAGAAGGGLFIVVFAKYFWEPGSAPDKPPDNK